MEILPLSSIEVTCVRHPSRSNGPSHHGLAVAVDEMETSMQLRRRRSFIVNLDLERLYECNGRTGRNHSSEGVPDFNIEEVQNTRVLHNIYRAGMSSCGWSSNSKGVGSAGGFEP